MKITGETFFNCIRHIISQVCDDMFTEAFRRISYSPIQDTFSTEPVVIDDGDDSSDDSGNPRTEDASENARVSTKSASQEIMNTLDLVTGSEIYSNIVNIFTPCV